MDYDQRSFDLEIRAEENGKLVGYASVFDSWSEDLGGFREIVRPGAFAKTLQESNDVRALFNHNPDNVLGRNKAGTLELVEDSRGLRVTIDPPDTTWAQDLGVSVKRGDINQMSFAFKTIKDRWFQEDDENKRELLEVSLDGGDVSIVTYPAYRKTRVSKRAIDKVNQMNEPEEPAYDHSAEQAASALAAKKRRLEHIEKTIFIGESI